MRRCTRDEIKGKNVKQVRVLLMPSRPSEFTNEATNSSIFARWKGPLTPLNDVDEKPQTFLYFRPFSCSLYTFFFVSYYARLWISVCKDVDEWMCWFDGWKGNRGCFPSAFLRRWIAVTSDKRNTHLYINS